MESSQNSAQAAYEIPEQSLVNNLTIISAKNGNEVFRVSLKSRGDFVIPRPGDVYEFFDNIEGAAIKGVVTKVAHRNGVSGGPAFNGAVEVIVES